MKNQSASLSLCVICCVGAALLGQEASGPRSSASPVLAWVGAEAITQADVDFLLGRSAAVTQADSPDASRRQPLSPRVQAAAIELWALQRQALETLRRTDRTATTDEIDTAINSRAPPEQIDWTTERIVDDLSQRHGIEPDDYVRHIEFRVAWPRYVERHLTEANLVRHFEAGRARFDGSRFQVDIVAIAVPPGRSAARTRAEQRLTELRQRWLTAPERWEQHLAAAAAQTELSVTRDRWVRGTGDLLRSLITPLLSMNAGELSEPVHSSDGVQLLRLVEKKTGELDVEQVRSDVRLDMLSFLLEYLARQSESRLPLAAEPPA